MFHRLKARLGVRGGGYSERFWCFWACSRSFVVPNRNQRGKAPRRPRGGQLPRLRQGTCPRLRWAWTTQARARVLPPKNGVGHGRGSSGSAPRPWPMPPQTTRSAPTTSNFGTAVNNNIVLVFSTGRLAQGRPGTRTWNHTCAKKQRQINNKSNVRPPKAPAMCTNAPASAHHASHDDPTWPCRCERSFGSGHYPARGARARVRFYY
jgi:hypothetical protein